MLRFMLFVVLVLVSTAASPIIVLASESRPTRFECEDGTSFTTRFEADTAAVELPSGAIVVLQARMAGSGFHYATPQYDMRGKGDEIQWTAGKQASLACHVVPDAAALFDAPTRIDEVGLPVDPANPDTKRRIRCYRYPDFAVKEVDYGEKGAQKLAVIAAGDACREEGADDRIPAGFEGYYLGAKGDFLFFTASDGWNGAMPFYVHDAKTLAVLFEDSFEGSGFGSLSVDGRSLKIEFRRAFSASCSLYLDGGNCPDQIKSAIPGLGDVAALPECGPAYDAEKQRTPDHAKEIEMLPSVISYQARLVFDGKAATVLTLPGPTSCRPPD